eukprot:GHVN01057683.1.p1 GENE.GHVN01057683.1~~GHVN01057683.1.p1  ORF type:complete len:244 (+),score=48.35 GHVN01057683.1:126-857(+)
MMSNNSGKQQKPSATSTPSTSAQSPLKKTELTCTQAGGIPSPGSAVRQTLSSAFSQCRGFLESTSQALMHSTSSKLGSDGQSTQREGLRSIKQMTRKTRVKACAGLKYVEKKAESFVDSVFPSPHPNWSMYHASSGLYQSARYTNAHLLVRAPNSEHEVSTGSSTPSGETMQSHSKKEEEDGDVETIRQTARCIVTSFGATVCTALWVYLKVMHLLPIKVGVSSSIVDQYVFLSDLLPSNNVD